MILSENRIVENISKTPVTLGDISESIFEGVSAKNGLLHRLYLPEEGGPKSFYFCESLCKPVFSEPELVYPYVPEAFSEKFVFRPSPYRFILPYEPSDEGRRKKYRVISPSELKDRFPMTYRRIMEFKKEFHHDMSPLISADYYSVKGREFMEYLYTPKIIAIEGSHLQAAYDDVGNYVFENGCGIVLKDPDKYPYITAVLNSPISRLFPVVCKSEMINSTYTAPPVMRRFPIVFPDNKLTEDLINTISSYLMFLNMERYATNCRVTDWLQELASFFEQISSLLILDTYLINDIDSRLLNDLEENIHPYAGDMESENSDSLLSALYCIKQRILETSSFGKYRFNMGLPEILNFLELMRLS
jgi:hypothetical protein